MSIPDEEDLTTEELLSMWDEGEPVTIISTRLELSRAPWAHTFQSAASGVLPEKLTMRPGTVVWPRGPSFQDSDSEDAEDALTRSA